MDLKKNISPTYFFKIITLFLLFINTGCFSYRSIEIVSEELEVDKKYKITTSEYQKKKMIITEYDESGIVATIKKEEVHIPFSEIKEIRKVKFSYFKTFIVLPASYIASGFGFVFLALAVR
ncbi:hypothetical protein M0D21_11500 [Aquimarina sp. D1M17]|uniref:hypothetical protein n=1 Tax=Aquimarina acroporae TaxID=2937283 RepID=UPI0020C05A75|nr:hypothetical protein [Aquimarina acroporae]MCK8522199.1 hypothetical protein [Aquimarina acroporae]